jgi:hypothetical protein
VTRVGRDEKKIIGRAGYETSRFAILFLIFVTQRALERTRFSFAKTRAHWPGTRPRKGPRHELSVAVSAAERASFLPPGPPFACAPLLQSRTTGVRRIDGRYRVPIRRAPRVGARSRESESAPRRQGCAPPLLPCPGLGGSTPSPRRCRGDLRRRRARAGGSR